MPAEPTYWIILAAWKSGGITYHGTWSMLSSATRWAEHYLAKRDDLQVWRLRAMNVGSEALDGDRHLLWTYGVTPDQIPAVAPFIAKGD